MGAVLPAIHPDLRNGQTAPGLFVKKLGRRDFVAFFVGHLLYGLTLGLLYASFWSGTGTDIAF